MPMNILSDIKSEPLLWIKAALMAALGIGCIAYTAMRLGWPTGALVVIGAWALCRAYYFAFYVIEKYADPTYRYDGLWDFAKYALGRARGR